MGLVHKRGREIKGEGESMKVKPRCFPEMRRRGTKERVCVE